MNFHKFQEFTNKTKINRLRKFPGLQYFHLFRHLIKGIQLFQKHAKTFCCRQAFRQKKNRLKIALQVSKLGFIPIVKAAPLGLSFWSFLTFLHHGIEQVERHLLRKFHKRIQRKSWSNMPPKLLACVKLYTKSAVSESSIALARLNLTFLTFGISP